MAKRLAELGALQDAVTNDEAAPSRLGLAGYIRGLFLDWSANPYNPLSRLTARGRLLGYFWDSGAIGLSMNFADQNFLVKDGTVKSKSFSDIVNFSRTTNATVTNSAGLITYAPHNLLTYSEQFDNAFWTKGNSVITANTIIAPNGYQTADKIDENTTNSTHDIAQLNLSVSPQQSLSFSIYVKSAERNRLQLRLQEAGTANYCDGSFNLVTLVTSITNGGAATGATAIITPVGSDWYRLTLTGRPSASTGTSLNVALFMLNASGANSYVGTAGFGMYLWGAQLEASSTATTYNSTTVKNLLGYSELFDNAVWTKSNSFVQTNLLTYSEAFDNASWVKVNGTVSANTNIAPNGYQTADTLISNNGSTANLVQSQSLTAGVTYSYSVYAKFNGDTVLRLQCNNGTSFAFADLNTQTGVMGTPSGTLTGLSATSTPVGNGWYRGVLTFIASTTAGSTMYLNAPVTGDGVKGTYIWGAQLVQGSVAGDYRRTDAAALPVYYPNHNGVVCAEKLVENTATAYHAVYGTTITAGTYMTSVYAKAGERNFLQLAGGGSVNDYITFNLTTGVITQTGSGASLGSITSTGNGWYRCSARMPLGSTGLFVTACQTGTSGWLPSAAGDGTSGIYIFGAQLSDSASLDPYVLNAATAPTAAAYYGARFDYDPVTLAPKGLLIEEQRSNLLLQSNTLNSASWLVSANVQAAVISTVNSPDGSLNAWKLSEASTTNSHQYIQSISTTAQAYTFSFYAKAAERSWVIVTLYDGTNNNSAWFNISTGAYGNTTTGVTSTITNLANGWYRVTCTKTMPVTAGAYAVIGLSTGDNVSVYAGTSGSGIIVYGAQLEAGAFATSYIPTAASQVTRAADVATIQGSNFYSWWNNNEGSLFANYSAAISGRYILSVRNAALTADRVVLWTNGFVAGTGGSFTDIVLIAKRVGAYKHNDAAMATNNVLNGTDTSVTIDYPAEAMAIGSSNGSATVMNGTIKSISYFPQRLSDSVLKGLTA